MSRRLTIGAAAAAVLAGSAFSSPAWAAAPAVETLAPFQLVRSLQLLQDRIADGDHAALPLQGKLLSMIDQRMRDANSLEFTDARNFNALMVYAMSGGNPATIDRLMQRLHLSDPERLIGTGVLYFLTGKPQMAKTRLAGVDPMTQPLELGASMALVRGSVTAAEEPEAALRLFDQARLLAPGTLVEEAALRRSLPVAVATKDAKRFVETAESYVRLYLRSPYAAEFAQAFVAGIIELQSALDMNAVDAIVAMMSREQREAIYLRLARKGAIDDIPSLSAFATKRVLPQSQPETGDPRALLYASMAAMKTEPVEAVAKRLDAIDATLLSNGDRELLEAVRSVVGEVLKQPARNAAPFQPDAAEPAAEATKVESPQKQATTGNPAPASEAQGHLPTNDHASAPVDLSPEEANARMAAARQKIADIDKLLAESSAQ